jgi:hypothetical protein
MGGKVIVLCVACTWTAGYLILGHTSAFAFSITILGEVAKQMAMGHRSSRKIKIE